MKHHSEHACRHSRLEMSEHTSAYRSASDCGLRESLYAENLSKGVHTCAYSQCSSAMYGLGKT